MTQQATDIWIFQFKPEGHDYSNLSLIQTEHVSVKTYQNTTQIKLKAQQIQFSLQLVHVLEKNIN